MRTASNNTHIGFRIFATPVFCERSPPKLLKILINILGLHMFAHIFFPVKKSQYLWEKLSSKDWSNWPAESQNWLALTKFLLMTILGQQDWFLDTADIKEACYESAGEFWKVFQDISSWDSSHFLGALISVEIDKLLCAVRQHNCSLRRHKLSQTIELKLQTVSGLVRWLLRQREVGNEMTVISDNVTPTSSPPKAKWNVHNKRASEQFWFRETVAVC